MCAPLDPSTRGPAGLRLVAISSTEESFWAEHVGPVARLSTSFLCGRLKKAAGHKMGNAYTTAAV